MNTTFEAINRDQQGLTLDFKRILSRVIKYWYLVVLSLMLSMAVAFYQNRYSLRIHPVSSSILIREVQEVGGAEFLYKNVLIDPYRNYLNEPYILRSIPLIEDVVRRLNFQVSFYREGYFLTSEAYSYVPIKAHLCNPNDQLVGQFILILLDEYSYSIGPYSSGDDSDDNPQVFKLADSIKVDDFEFCITRIQQRSIKEFIGIPFLLTIQKPSIIAESYVNRLKVEWAEKGAGVLNLSITGSNPEKEIDFINELISRYSARDLENKNEAAIHTIDFIQNQLRSIKDSLQIVEFQLERFGNESRIKDMSIESQRLLSKLETFQVQQAELLIRQNYYEYLETYLSRSSGQLDQIILPSTMGISDPILSSLISKMVDLQLEVKSYVQSEHVSNPLISIKLERLKELRKDVQEALKALKSTDNIKSDFLAKQMHAIERQLTLLPASERQLISIQRNYALLENMYVFLMQKLSEAGISKAANTSDVEMVNPPVKGPAISPKPAQNYTVAAMLGLAIPLLIFVLFEIFDNKVQSKEDIDKMTSIPFIGGIGHNTSSSNLTVKDRPKSGVAESFRALRSNLNYFTSNKVKQVFMVSSSISGEGKTFTTINLATVFALSGKRTLIVGADMRRPKLFEDFDRSNEVGLSTFLSGLNEFDAIIQDTSIQDLYMVSGGPVPPNPSELLLTDRFELFIRKALEQFDFVIIDTPPLALVTDAFVISKFVDHTVFVLRQNYSHKLFVRNIDEYHRSGKIKHISMLLNDIYKSGLGYGYGQDYAYHYGYSYGQGSAAYYTDDDDSDDRVLAKKILRSFRKRS
ncbi:MAG: polysaccharide biosynthesis tyrosine autokinase [Cyclobacteriaceae bacterium]|nr:polysaccharide biosynthesis tyrosine autokinase [Cyclobacteriaceae bacterium]